MTSATYFHSSRTYNTCVLSLDTYMYVHTVAIHQLQLAITSIPHEDQTQAYNMYSTLYKW